jgi:hypothetical protein
MGGVGRPGEVAAEVTGVKKLRRLPSGSRNRSARLPQGIVVGSLTKSSTKPVRFWCAVSTSSTRNSMMTLRLSAGFSARGGCCPSGSAAKLDAVLGSIAFTGSGRRANHPGDRGPCSRSPTFSANKQPETLRRFRR